MLCSTVASELSPDIDFWGMVHLTKLPSEIYLYLGIDDFKQPPYKL